LRKTFAMTLDLLQKQVRERRALPTPLARRALRRAAGVSLASLAQALDVSRETCRLWELGLAEPRGPNLAAYLEALEIFREGGT